MLGARSVALPALMLLCFAFSAPAWSGQSPAREKTPAEILTEKGPMVALLVSADDETLGLGSGFLVKDGSMLITNYHVIAGAKRLLVKLSDGSIIEVSTVAAFDADKDLAAVVIPSGPRVGLQLGDSDAVHVGEPIVVISNPKGLEHSVSNGLISGIRNDEKLPKILQISAPISPGSSGGPVFNQRGEVIGVVSFYLEGGQNLNFAIPSNFVKELLKRNTNVALADVPKIHEGGKGTASEDTLDGPWIATFADSVSTGQMSFVLTQDSARNVSGTYTTSLGGGGSITGLVIADEFRFELSQTLRDCPGRFVGTAKVRPGAISGTYSGNGCDGVHTNGTFSMSRGTNMAIAAAPTRAVANEKPIFEYGTASELRDVRTVYVYCEDLEVKGNILKTLSKEHDLAVINEPAKADVILVFGASTFSLGNSTYVWSDTLGNVHGTTTPRYGITGVGFAVRIVGPNTARILWQYQTTRTTLLQRRPSTNFAREFVSLLKKVRK